MKHLTVVLIIALIILASAAEFSLGIFEYQNGIRGFANIKNEIDIGQFTLGLKHWIFFRAYNFGKFDFPKRITPFDWESSGGWWDVYVRFNFTDNFFFQFLHRSEHNFDGIHYLNIHWYNFFEFGFSF